MKGKRLEWAEWNELKVHHAGLPQRERLQELVRFDSARDIHRENDAASFRLKVPLVDFTSEMQAYGRANLRRHVRSTRFERALGSNASDRQHLCRGNINHGRRCVLGWPDRRRGG